MTKNSDDAANPESQVRPDGVGRRTVLLGGVGGALALSGVRPAFAAAADDAPLRAAVLEFRDQWTKATGLAQLLGRAGVEVIPLDVTKGAAEQAQTVDLIAFGSFTNNDVAYGKFVESHGESLRTFVDGGGVVLELTQSDQFGPAVTYLPAGTTAIRDDRDFDAIYPVATDHPLVKALPVSGGQVLAGRNPAIRTSWESLVEWTRMRVLMSGTSGGVQPPCLLEGAHGSGRWVISSLTVDKCFGVDGTPVQPAAAISDSETFFAAVAAYVRMVKAGTAPEVVPTPQPGDVVTGPMVGDVGTKNARLWLRPGPEDREELVWACTVIPAVGPGAPVHRVTAEISRENDHTMIFDVPRLAPDTEYTFAIRPHSRPTADPHTGSFTTAPPDHRPAVVTMGLGSCAPSVSDPVWNRIMEEGVDSFVMLGDTPYIDSPRLDVARRKQRDFLRVPEVAELISTRPIWGTWDDHDFGVNDTDGNYVGKENTRKAFVDYRANSSYGQTVDGELQTGRDEGEGVYTSFRRGPIEIFLIDPRWFSRTGPSWADPAKQTCTGEVQWQWLREQLQRSTATFKALATGMIWDDKQNSESDDWGTYQHEREAIFDFITKEKIPGVFLLGGDIHVSRALNYGARVGYDLWQFIVSPLHNRTIPSLNVPHPALVHSAVEPNVFLKLVADTTVKPATLTATWINSAGKRIFEVHRTSTDMGHRR
ncbi:alkaline phosphatase D family protein [Kribbella catacumbae]|uniref:alkaline phosphatase D family protein n=1 Tax=Kribbella catacumbae TaxID=460086 RepID=UPI00036E83A4|nr:alkaline phosphatase D family protein [Kribbella catacumbae]